jgi:predicted RNase H-like HicB family nuclease
VIDMKNEHFEGLLHSLNDALRYAKGEAVAGMRVHHYIGGHKIILEPISAQDGGGWLATVPALSGCMGDGETQAEAVADALLAIEEWKDSAKQLGSEA